MTASPRACLRVLTVAALSIGCSGASRVPPGLPPPEYEQPAVSPWPPPGASDPATDGSEPQGESLGRPPASEAPAEATGAAGAPGE